jgi:TPR repeat protein
MSLEGQGAPQDYQTAHMWLNIAAMGGDEGTVKFRDLVAKELTTCQLGAAQKMAREWFAENSLRLLRVPTH